MSKAKETVEATGADFLRDALSAPSAAHRARFAERGLACEDSEEDTRWLLMRQLYLAHLELRELEKAADVAEAMVLIATMPDVAHHDAARVHAALGDLEKAIQSQRLAARAAPPERRSFHFWSLATLQHFAGREDGALASLDRAERWATRDRTLIRAHRAYVHVAAGRTPEGLAELLSEVSDAKARDGYAGFLLGMIWYHIGDTRSAAAELRAFLRRHAGADTAKTLTLIEELRRARAVLVEVDAPD
ncbi:MAG: tetratricopeptide repeat protein [Myxococcota bacterium]